MRTHPNNSFINWRIPPSFRSASIICALIALAGAASAEDCNCAVGEAAKASGRKPTVTINILPCDKTRTEKITAPITCSSVRTGTATNDCVKVPEWDSGKIGQKVATSVSVAGECDHGNTVSGEVTVEFYHQNSVNDKIGDSSLEAKSLHFSLSLGYNAGKEFAGALSLSATTIPSRDILSPERLELYGGRGIDVVRGFSQGQLARLSYLQHECESIEYQIKHHKATSSGPDAAEFEKKAAAELAKKYERLREAREEIQDIQGAPDGAIKQLRSAEGFLKIESINEQSYKIAVYKPSELGAEFNIDGEYMLKPDAQPFVTYTISNPDGEARFDRLRIVEVRGGKIANQSEFSWTNNGVWELNKGNGAYRTTVVEDGSIKTWRVYNQDGTIASETRNTYIDLQKLDGSGTERFVVEEVHGTGADALITSISYHTDTNAPHSYGYTKQRVEPDGKWTTYEYDEASRQSVIRTGWLDAGLPEEGSSSYEGCAATVFTYEPFLPGGQLSSGLCDNGDVDHATPRSETILINGIPVSKTLRTIAMDTMGYRVVEEVRLLDPAAEDLAAAWNHPDNPRTVSWYMPEDDFKPCSKKLEKIEYPDGRTECYTYISGTYTPEQNGHPGAFEEDPTGADFITIITQGTKDSPFGIPNRTTQERRYARKSNLQEFLNETYVCVASNDYERINWTSTLYNDSDLPIRVTNSNGTYTETGWDGNLIAWEVSVDGIRTDYAYDSLGRVISATRNGHGIRPDMITSTIYDGVGRILSTTISADTLSMTTTNAYDAAGRLVWTRGADGIETAYEYSALADTTIRGYNTALASTNTVVRYLDGRIAYTEFNGIRKATYAYGISNGLQWETTYEGPQAENSPVWATPISDSLGRVVESRRPGFGGATLITRNTYNAASQLLCTTTFSEQESQLAMLSTQLFTYDELGETTLSAQDINQNGVIDLAGPDRVSSSTSSFVKLNNDWWQESNQYVYPEDNSDAPLRISTSRRRITGLGATIFTKIGDAILTSESASVDALNNISTQQSFLNRANHSRLSLSQRPDSILPFYSISTVGLSLTNVTATGIVTTRTYDALGRVTAITDGRGNTSTMAYNATGQAAYTEDAIGNRTSFTYDAIGRRIAVTDALGQITHTEYDSENRVIQTWGAIYPVAYDYNDFGRMVKLHTWRDENGAPDTTQWIYDSATGLLIQKLYADGKGPSYAYSSDARITTRTWARGITTSYSYDVVGQLVGVDYSDSTPDMTFTYDRIGNQRSAITAGVATNLYAYSLMKKLTAETVVTADGATTIDYSYDGFGRPTGYILDNGHGVDYGYDEFGRFQYVSSAQTAETFTYSYLHGSSLISGMTASSNHAWARSYEPHRNLISTVENFHGAAVISRFDYENDAIGRRVSRIDSGLAFPNPAFEKYTYNIRSEVIGSQRYHGTDVSDTSRVYGGRGFGYNYDSIGNRITTTESIGDQSLTHNYTVNELNQYTFIANPADVGLRGDTVPNAIVTVNGETAFIDSAAAIVRPWHYALPANNAVAADYPLAQISATISASDANEFDSIDSASGSIYAPPQSEVLSYDDDGNLLNDGRWQYTWNGENRLILAEEYTAPNNRDLRKVEYTYDHKGRTVRKIISRSGINAKIGEDGETCLYIWNGFNIIVETTTTDSVTNRTYNIWGLDIDGTMQWSGGVGGLLAVAKDYSTYYPTFDANGNIMEYVTCDGGIICHREYDPFGGTIVAVGDLNVFSHWFSTKPLCTVTGLSEYQFRKYSSMQGRWLSRDPAFLDGGINYYVMCANAPQLYIDGHGLLTWPSWLREKLPDSILALDDLFEFAIDVLQDKEMEINLSHDIMTLVRNDPGMETYESSIIEKVVKKINELTRPKTIMWQQTSFAFNESKLVGFGGNRAPGNMMDQLLGFWKPEYRATWKVGINPLTWMIRNVTVRTSVSVEAAYNCLSYWGVATMSHSFTDELDLRPRKHDNHDFKLLLNPKEHPYDAVTILLGTIWHDVLGFKDNLKVKGDWRVYRSVHGEFQ